MLLSGWQVTGTVRLLKIDLVLTTLDTGRRPGKRVQTETQNLNSVEFWKVVRTAIIQYGVRMKNSKKPCKHCDLLHLEHSLIHHVSVSNVGLGQYRLASFCRPMSIQQRVFDNRLGCRQRPSSHATIQVCTCPPGFTATTACCVDSFRMSSQGCSNDVTLAYGDVNQYLVSQLNFTLKRCLLGPFA